MHIVSCDDPVISPPTYKFFHASYVDINKTVPRSMDSKSVSTLINGVPVNFLLCVNLFVLLASKC